MKLKSLILSLVFLLGVGSVAQVQAGENQPVKFLITLQEVLGLEADFNPVPEGCTVWWKGYVLRPTRITSRKQLIRVLSEDGKEESLPEPSKATLALYDATKTQKMKERLAFAATVDSAKIQDGVIRLDIFDLAKIIGKVDEAKIKYDFIAQCDGVPGKTRTILVSSLDSDGPTKTGFNKTLTHETAHMLDNVSSGPGGWDFTHYVDERTEVGTAWAEGWARFNELLDDPTSEPLAPYSRLKWECWDSTPLKPHYIYLTPEYVYGPSFLEVEGIIGTILYDMAMQIPNGLEIVQDAFRETNSRMRVRLAPDLMRRILARHPEHLGEIVRIVETATSGRLRNQDFLDFLGTSDALEAILKKRVNPPPPLDFDAKSPRLAEETPLVPRSGVQGTTVIDRGADSPRAGSSETTPQEGYLDAIGE